MTKNIGIYGQSCQQEVINIDLLGVGGFRVGGILLIVVHDHFTSDRVYRPPLATLVSSIVLFLAVEICKLNHRIVIDNTFFFHTHPIGDTPLNIDCSSLKKQQRGQPPKNHP